MRAAALHTASGYLRSDAVSKWPAASASTAMPCGGPLARERPRVALDRGARRARVRHPREPVVRGERDVDDRAAAGRLHRELGGGAGHALGAADVQPHHGAPPLRLDRLGRHEVLPAGVVDEHVETAVTIEARSHEPICVRVLAHVPGRERGARPDPLGRLREHALAPAGDHHPRAAGGQLGRRREPQPGPAAGDEHDAPLEHPGGEDLRRGGRHPAAQSTVSHRSPPDMRGGFAGIKQSCRSPVSTSRR